MFTGVICRRNWALRLSIVLNVCVLLYVCAHFGAVSGPWVEDTYNAAAAAAASPSNPASSVQQDMLYGAAPRPNSTSGTSTEQQQGKLVQEKSPLPASAVPPAAPAAAAVDFKTNESKPEIAVNGEQDKKINLTQQQITQQNAKRELTLQEAISCNDKSSEPKTAQRGDFWVLYNYVTMSDKPHCWESVTYTTHADYTFLDNLNPLLERWRAPISIALHAPGGDFPPTIEAIKYARTCGSPLVAKLVTFHVYFSSKHVPKMIPSGEKIAAEKVNCSKPAPWVNASVSHMYKSDHKLLYPVNVGRNVARESAPTHYVLASDIELYPSPDLPAKFLEMIRRNDQAPLHKPNPKVFVLSIFEVDEKSLPPANKTALMQMLKAGTAIPFHKKLCSGCHNVPRSKEWQEAAETSGLHVFHVGKRVGSFIHWEPIYIGTNNDPLYDERLSWEGKSDKMTQGYALCVLDYDFMILDNAFLVHRPGIKVFKKDNYRDTLTAKTNILIKKIIIPELKILYGTRKGCAV
ncbi:beta-1,4-glucuronyltransferase 1 isoform X2 [Phymastichus coffea]|uniref:beta-1,4-glucuronyltransferase 1 isoform X2 n=1 Tax=Phymastichus coffea TaxID=108790 RepID=UPI00273B3F8C|nr:beta-1,4-glucuronyltransferase 1 isoform X2 [Phymastichus coffea]